MNHQPTPLPFDVFRFLGMHVQRIHSIVDPLQFMHHQIPFPLQGIDFLVVLVGVVQLQKFVKGTKQVKLVGFLHPFVFQRDDPIFFQHQLIPTDLQFQSSSPQPVQLFRHVGVQRPRGERVPNTVLLVHAQDVVQFVAAVPNGRFHQPVFHDVAVVLQPLFHGFFHVFQRRHALFQRGPRVHRGIQGAAGGPSHQHVVGHGPPATGQQSARQRVQEAVHHARTQQIVPQLDVANGGHRAVLHTVEGGPQPPTGKRVGHRKRVLFGQVLHHGRKHGRETMFRKTLGRSLKCCLQVVAAQGPQRSGGRGGEGGGGGGGGGGCSGGCSGNKHIGTVVCIFPSLVRFFPVPVSPVPVSPVPVT